MQESADAGRERSDYGTREPGFGCPSCLPFVLVRHPVYPAFLPALRSIVVAGTPPGLLTLGIEAIRSLAGPLFACLAPYTLARALATPRFVRLFLTCPNNLTRTTPLEHGG